MGIQLQLVEIGLLKLDTYAIACQLRALKWILFYCFPICKTDGICFYLFSLKRFSQASLPQIFISNWTLCRTIQGVIVLVVSNAQLLPEFNSTKSND